MHIVLLTRADPPLPLNLLRARNYLTEIRAADLRFGFGGRNPSFDATGVREPEEAAELLADRIDELTLETAGQYRFATGEPVEF